MTGPQKEPGGPSRLQRVLPDRLDLHSFTHEAMACIFGMSLIHPDRQYAHQAACETFDVLDALEQNLSRFIDNSEVNQINRLEAGQCMLVEEATFQCIAIALEAYRITGGKFDIDYQSSGKPNRKSLNENLHLDPEAMTLGVVHQPVSLDLGGIGKGFALGKMVESLREWGIDSGLVQGGQSSILAFSKEQELLTWHLNFILPERDGEIVHRCKLHDSAIGASGLFKGPHIIDPGTSKPAQQHIAVWANAPNAAMADALSTGCMMMEARQIRKLCESQREIAALKTTYDPKTGELGKETFGQMP